MRIINALAIATALAASGPGLARAQVANPTCAAPEARQFDFWLGDWAIEQRILRQDGSYAEFPARTSVRPAAAGCALVEAVDEVAHAPREMPQEEPGDLGVVVDGPLESFAGQHEAAGPPHGDRRGRV